VSGNTTTSTAHGAHPVPTLTASALRAFQEPGKAASFGLALLKGFWYRAYFRARGMRFRAGRRLLVFGRLDVRGAGEVIFGNDVVIWGRVNPWTYSANARIIVGDHVMMSGTRFGCMQEIRIGRDSILADASIRDTDFHSTRADRRSVAAPIRVAPVDVGNNVWIAAGAVLLPGTQIGENSVVGASAVCMRSFPPNKVILGNPAKVAMPIPSLEEPGSALTIAEDVLDLHKQENGFRPEENALA
jgi:acetyltransferase-like isoleucine patch superfamily enzyme